MTSNCIYGIFQWMGIPLKYTGYIPLPGVYEGWTKKDDWKETRLLLSILLPLLNCCISLFTLFDTLYLGIGKDLEWNLSDTLNYLLLIIYSGAVLLGPLVFHRRTSPKLVLYLQKHREINQLLLPHRRHLTTTTNAIFLLSILNNFIIILAFWQARNSRYNGAYEVYEYVSLAISLYVAVSIAAQPQIMYVAFQYVLKCAFHQLLAHVREERNGDEKLSLEDVKRRLRLYGSLYCSLCQLCKLLDDMTSPLIAYQFLYCYVLTLFSCTFFEISITLVIVMFVNDMVSSAIVLIVVPLSAHQTQRAALKILPALYASFPLNREQIVKEMQIFSTQTLQLNVEFSASGLFTLDRKLVLSIIQSIIKNWVVFFKFHIENKEK